MGLKNEGPKKKQLLSDDEMKLVKQFHVGRNLEVLDYLKFPGWEKDNWARNRFAAEQARKAKEREELEASMKAEADREAAARDARLQKEKEEELERRRYQAEKAGRLSRHRR